MLTKRFNDQDVFYNVMDIGLRMYGNGHSYSKPTIDFVHEYCRQQLRNYFNQHNQLKMMSQNERLSYLATLVYFARHRKSTLKRLQQFIQAKDRPTIQQDELVNNMVQDKKLTLSERFQRICRQTQIDLDNAQSQIVSTALDQQRSRQYARLDAYYNSDTLTRDAYLSFVEQQHSSFNNLRLLSPIDIQHWLEVNVFTSLKKFSSNQDIRVTEICVFLIKEILLDLMDHVHQSSSIQCHVRDIIRRRHVKNHSRLPFSGRRRRILLN